MLHMCQNYTIYVCIVANHLCSYGCKFAIIQIDVVKQNNIFYLAFTLLSLLILNEQLTPNIQEHINQAKQQHPTPTDRNPIGKRWKQSKPSSHIPQIHRKKRKKSLKKLKLTWDFLHQRSCNFAENPKKD